VSFISLGWPAREAVILTHAEVLAFSVRFYRCDFKQLSEDEVAKWAAIQSIDTDTLSVSIARQRRCSRDAGLGQPGNGVNDDGADWHDAWLAHA
jgi:hypothetical protein